MKSLMRSAAALTRGELQRKLPPEGAHRTANPLEDLETECMVFRMMARAVWRQDSRLAHRLWIFSTGAALYGHRRQRHGLHHGRGHIQDPGDGQQSAAA
eukprot:3483845-Pyramimonas_sp.AAC.1